MSLELQFVKSKVTRSTMVLWYRWHLCL